jgi:hypothetical protein
VLDTTPRGRFSMAPDKINGLYEFLGACFISMNVWRVYKDKKVSGVALTPTFFFTSWGFWNLYYYPSLDQWWSFSGGLFIVIMNMTWLGMAVYYGNKSVSP